MGTLAFDVYGTLIDPLGVGAALHSLIGDQAPVFAQAWREKQLEYTFRRALMRDYRDFRTCTREALSFVDARLGTRLQPSEIEALMASYLQLPAYPDVQDTLTRLRGAGHRVFAFSNGHPEDLERLLTSAGLAQQLDGIVSVHPTGSFKPDPTVYRHFIAITGASVDSTWLVSGNSFDVLGAAAVGWRTAWVRRDPQAVIDPWGVEPTITITALQQLAALI